MMKVSGDSANVAVTSYSLLRNVLDTEHEDWGKLVRLYTPLVYHWCRKSGLNEDQTLEVAQDVLLGVYRGLSGFLEKEERPAFRAWLSGIAKHKIADFLRRRYRSVGHARGGSTAVEVLEGVPQPTADNDRLARAHEQKILLRRALSLIEEELNPKHVKIFKCLIDGISVDEISEKFGVTKNVIYLVRHRIVAKLRAEFGDSMIDLDP